MVDIILNPQKFCPCGLQEYFKAPEGKHSCKKYLGKPLPKRKITQKKYSGFSQHQIQEGGW